MKVCVKFLTGITLITLAACSTNKVIQDTPANSAIEESPSVASEAGQMPGQNPPMTIMKGRKKLNLVRIMDGEICKNEFQGAKGAFLLYANQKDIDRIKREKGAAIFSDFETKIEHLSGGVLQEAIDNTNLSEDPFALDADEAQQKLANKLVTNFRSAASDVIDMFEKETTLTIEIAAFPPSLVFYQKGCETTLSDPESTDSANPINAYF